MSSRPWHRNCEAGDPAADWRDAGPIPQHFRDQAEDHGTNAWRCTTSVCVESTLRDVTARDYSCLLLADCTAESNGQEILRRNPRTTVE
ncbi:MAG TPA: isochorismatase family protein [Dehalococcoidia bacterium]|nr:isochorismatase family protein [Dehalococcoidia bacterium]